MKRLILSLVALQSLLIAVPSKAESNITGSIKSQTEGDVEEKADKPPSSDFRNTTWRATKDEVKSSEKAKLLDESGDDALVYSEKFADYDALLLYLFSENKLTTANYLIQLNTTDPKDFLAEYDKVKALVVKLHGKSSSDETIWENEELKNDPAKLGEALQNAHFHKKASWTTPTSDVRLLLAKLNGIISLQVIYALKGFTTD